MLILIVLAATGCTAGLRSDSNGWSPVSALSLPSDSGIRLVETSRLSPLDNTLSVTNGFAFELGQVIQIEQELMLVTLTRDDELVVERGVNGTRPVSHPGQLPILSVGQQFVVFVTTKQGEIQAMVDDGSSAPEVDASFIPAGASQ
ncbi:MAG: hypothetical protein BZY75_00690 [SAR202 cluster bacterium Io17-Chloro-G7]|nr:MAG: hypothetical protein BZY75_00690 [SAR202 cluster bacterium Io17-Chloro-G7]